MDQWFRAARTGDISYIKAHCRQMKGSRTTSGGYTALMIAARYGYREVVSLLKNYEARIYCDTHWTALMFACDSGHQPIVQELAPLEAGLSDYRGITGLMRASLHGFTTIIKTLFSYEGELNATLKEPVSDFPKGCNALAMAMMSGHKESVQLLLSLESSSLTTAIVQECVRNHELTDAQTDCISLVTSFLEQRAMIADPSFRETHPWFYAAATNDVQYIQDHISDCAKLTNSDDGDKCALFYAIIHGAKDVAEMLFELEKDCIDSSQNGFTSYLRDTAFKDIIIGSSASISKQLVSTTPDPPSTTEPSVTLPTAVHATALETTDACSQDAEISNFPDQVEESKKPVSTASLLHATPRLTIPTTKPIPLRAANTRTTPQEARRPKSKEPRGVSRGTISPGPNRSRSTEKLATHRDAGPVTTPMKQTPSKESTRTVRSGSRFSSASRSVPRRASSSDTGRNISRKSFNKVGPYDSEPHVVRSRIANKGQIPAISKLVKESVLKASAQNMSQELVSVCTSDNCRTISERTEENDSPRDLSLPCVSIGVAHEKADITDEAAHLFSQTKVSNTELSIHNSSTGGTQEDVNSPEHDDCFKLLAKCAVPSAGSVTITPGATNRPSKYSPRGDGSFEGVERSLSALLAGISEKIERLDVLTKQNTEQCASLSTGFEKITTLITGHNEQIENIVKTQQALTMLMLQEKSSRDRSETGSYSAATPSSVIADGRMQPFTVPRNTDEPVVVCTGEPNAKLNSMSASVCGEGPQQLSILSPNESSLYDQTRFVTKSVVPAALSAIYTGPLHQPSTHALNTSNNNSTIYPESASAPLMLMSRNPKSFFAMKGYINLFFAVLSLVIINSITCNTILTLQA
ncbi:Ser/Thr protein kinase [Giardia lamblia P15]|uniref:Ser/Thr protein kinase n=1 Tax=Giardia intestinalis (strain P15) TaxID=658858 RepID=E1F1W5_GIAIA|nr:Ser/Thr protein kinase [Giardia lamblia P15]